LERLKLAGGEGWISSRRGVIPTTTTNARTNDDDICGYDDHSEERLEDLELLVRFFRIDASFDPNNPGKFHLDRTMRVMEEPMLYTNKYTNRSSSCYDQGIDESGGSGGIMTSVGISASGRGGVSANDDVGSALILSRNEVSTTGLDIVFTVSQEMRSLARNSDLKDIGERPRQDPQLSPARIGRTCDGASNALLSMSLNNGRAVSRGITAAAASAKPFSSSMVYGGGALISSALIGSSSSSSSTASVPAQFNVMDAIRKSSSGFLDCRRDSDPNNRCLICLSDERTSTVVHGETGHIACCLACARILKARGDNVSFRLMKILQIILQTNIC
jgi:hypothetical protein